MIPKQLKSDHIAASTPSDILSARNKKASANLNLFLQRIGPMAVLILTAIIWGGTFLVTQNAIKLSGPFTYLFFCFGFGALTLSLIFRRQIVHVTPTEIKGGLLGTKKPLKPHKIYACSASTLTCSASFLSASRNSGG